MAKFIDPQEPIAIIGLGGIFPGAKNIPAFWENICGKVDSIIEVPKDRWDWELFYSQDRSQEDKTYSKIGGFVLDFDFQPLKLRIPPTVAKQMDSVQQMAVTATAEALADAGYEKKAFDRTRTAVIFGNAMGGPKKEESDYRIYAFRYLERLKNSSTFSQLPDATRSTILAETEKAVKDGMLPITEDSMPGELSNVIAGRVANTFNVNGPNFTVDAACAASLGALSQAVNGLRFRQFDMAITGGIDQMMAAPAYVKFSKIGALSPDGSRPFDQGANGFVMGEGAGVLILKRLSDAKEDGDKIYALIRSIGASSDGKGKGITAPNPKGQKLAMERAFDGLDYGPADVGLLEAHGTSTPVGDVVEVRAASEIFSGVAPKSVALGSIKSQIGHLKAAAGAASLIKAALAMYHKKLPPSINFQTPNPGIDWDSCPFYVNTEVREWVSEGKTRRANVSAFGFGGTNFHIALEEADERSTDWKPSPHAVSQEILAHAQAAKPLDPSLGGETFFVRGANAGQIFNQLEELKGKAPDGPLNILARETSRTEGDIILAIAAESGAKLREKIDMVFKHKDQGIWAKPPMPFKPKAIRVGRAYATRPKVAFLFPGQGSQYVDMMKDLSLKYQVVADTFAEADKIMEGLIGEKLTDILFTREGEGEAKYKERQERIKQTEITQPAVLTADVALLRLIRQYGVDADIVAGHSLGEYGALVAAGVLRFDDALLAVSARGKEMADVKVDDNGSMAFVGAALDKVDSILAEIDGYVIAANKNCPTQTVIAGTTAAVAEAVRRFKQEGLQSQTIEVSHAFHSDIVAPATQAYGRFLKTLSLSPPKIPVSSNVTAEYYPKDEKDIRDLMIRQIAAPVEFIRQVERMYQDGIRVFVEVGPKRALTAFVTSTLSRMKDVTITAANHPKRGGIHEFNDLLASLAAAGVKLDLSKTDVGAQDSLYTEAFKSWIRSSSSSKPVPAPVPAPSAQEAAVLETWDLYLGPVVVSGIAAGAPGKSDRLFRENAMDAIIDGQNMIDPISAEDRQKMVDKNIERLAKSDTGAHGFEKLDSIDKVLQLAGQAGEFDMSKEFGIRGSVSSLMDTTAKMALAAGVLALKDAGLPLLRRYKKTTTGSMIPTQWALPRSIGERTGVILASAFPGLDSLIDEMSRHFADKYLHRPQRDLWAIFDKMLQAVSDSQMRRELTNWYADQRRSNPPQTDGGYKFSRVFLFRILSLGHAQLAQYIGAKGPCTQINAACASTTQAVGIAEDWIRTGRADRVLIVSSDDITNATTLEWLGPGFLVSGATSTHNVVSETALPFDRRRHGMIIGMGASALVVEDARHVEARGMQPLAELLATQFENSAFHVTRLNTPHVARTMGKLLAKAEKRFGISRSQIAGKTLFMSHETYTPAQGGSSAAEVEALKATFGSDTDKVIVTNTKGFTGHSMGASLEDVIAIRAMNVGRLPPIANYKEADPNLAGITLSKGGAYDCQFALRLGAGFGSQIAMTLMRNMYKTPAPRVTDAPRYRRWLEAISNIPNPETEITLNTLRIKDPGREVMRALAEQGSAPAASPRLAAPPSLEAKPPKDLNKDAVTKEILALVSEKTGYPGEMLELDLDMEADLGIDTVKQAEMIGLIREKYAIAKEESLSLKDYPTLTHVINFVLKGGASPGADRPAVIPESAPAPVVAVKEAPKGSGPDEATVTQEILALVSEKTGYPGEMLELDLDMEADLGIDTVKQAEMIGLIREKYAIAKEESLSLKDYPTLRHVIKFVLSGGAALPAAPSVPRAAAAETPIAIPAPMEFPAASGAPTAAEEERVTQEIITLVAEKTGYPREMLELDLDMEADLGIDTVKQAEMIGTIREKYGIAKEENISLKDYPTLRDVVRFVLKTPADAAGSQAAREKADEVVTEAITKTKERFTVRLLQAYQRPASSAIPSMEKGKTVVILTPDTETAEPFAKAIAKAGGTSAVLKSNDWKTIENFESALKSVLEGKKAQGLLDLTGLALGDFDSLTAAGFDRIYRRSARVLFMAARALREDLLASPKTSWILSITQIDGKHGMGKGARNFSPLAGALTGLTKGLAREFEGMRVHAVDFDASAKPAQMAGPALGELGSDDPRIEIGYCEGIRYALRLVAQTLPEKALRSLTQRSVVLITGGGQGLGAEMAKELARKHKCTLILLGRTPLRKEAATWVRFNDTELKEMKSEMWAEMKKDKTHRATPAMLEREFGKITKSIGLQRNIEEMCRSGSKVSYIPTDLADGAAVTKALKRAVRQYNNIDYILHAAGLEESKLLADKKLENFDRVVRAKMHGAFHLLKAVPKTGAQTFAFFSSIVGRFGNMGQTDYAAASDFLAKLASHLNANGRRGMTFDLTAFSEIGMATRGGVELFLKSQGVDFMPPQMGISKMLEQLLKNSGDSEVLIAGSIGKLDSDGLIEGTTAPAQNPEFPQGLGSLPNTSVLYDAVVSENSERVVTKKKFSLESDPWLKDHAISGTPWVAGVMGLELFAETAARLTGQVPSVLSDVSFALPIKLLRDRPITIRAEVDRSGNGLSYRLVSDFISPKGIKLGAPRTHFEANSGGQPPAWEADLPPVPGGDGWAVPSAQIYDAYFHGPRFQVLAGVATVSEQELVAVYRRTREPLWQDDPRALVFQPMLIEAAFQACGYRDLHYTQKMSLPDSVGTVQVFRRDVAPNELYIHVVYKGTQEGQKSLYDARVYDAQGRVWVALRDYRMIFVS